jgi:hypothetical protein
MALLVFIMVIFLYFHCHGLFLRNKGWQDLKIFMRFCFLTEVMV